MSRFSKSEAEARGWSIVLARPERLEFTSETQGEQRVVPAEYRAEKFIDSLMINVTAETQGKLLERISEYEARREAMDMDVKAREVEPTSLDEAGLPIRNVELPSGERISEEEYASRGSYDVTEEGLVGPSPELAEAEEAKQQGKRDSEPESPEQGIESEDIIILDAAGGVADVVRALPGEENWGDIQARTQADSKVAEEKRAAESSALNSRNLNERPAEVEATPAAEALAEEDGVDLSGIEGSGKDGRVIKPDVEAVLADED